MCVCKLPSCLILCNTNTEIYVQRQWIVLSSNKSWDMYSGSKKWLTLMKIKKKKNIMYIKNKIFALDWQYAVNKMFLFQCVVFVHTCVNVHMYVRISVSEQLEEGKLWFQLTCSLGDGSGRDGDSSGLLGMSGSQVNDGSWHTVTLEVNQNFSILALDDSYTEHHHGPLFIQTLATDRTFYLGALVSSEVCTMPSQHTYSTTMVASLMKLINVVLLLNARICNLRQNVNL